MMAEHDQRSLVPADAARLLTRLVRARRRRADFFGNELFGEPAWDILLELSLARLEGRQVTLTSLLPRLSVGETTVARWIDKLEVEGWLRRSDKAAEAGDTLDLSARGVRAMQAWIGDLIASRAGAAEDPPIMSLLERIDRGRRESGV